ncbi:HD-GYP domain-containing protein [Candidatus Moduliflexota bacterium]
MKNEKVLKKLLFSMSTLEELGEVLSSQQEFRENVRMSLYSVMGSIPVSKGALFLYRPGTRAFVLEACRGAVLEQDLRIPISESQAEQLRGRRKVVRVSDPSRRFASLVRRSAEVMEKLQAEVVQPLNYRQELIGLIALGPKFNGEGYADEDFDLLSVMANYIAIGIHNQELFTSLESSNIALRRKASQNRRLYRNLEAVYHDTIRALGAAIDAKDPYTRGHSDRVASFSEAIARRLGMNKKQVAAVRVASHLHDIGKIAIDNSILLKPGRLNEQEMDQIHRHPTVSYDILSNIKFPYPDVAMIARHHHEWVNGSGYPDRVSVENLNTGMKILSLADAFDAMTSDRPYRPALDLEVALREVHENVSVQFDRKVTQAFFHILRDEVAGDVESAAIVSRIRSRYSPTRIKRYLGKVNRELKGERDGAVSRA